MENLIEGILVVDKEKNMTSHDVVDAVRKRFKIKKVGHAGTLDPAATGVLVLLLGKATKLSNQFLEQDKEYEATMKLGEVTDTCDGDGAVTETREVNVSPEEILEAVKKFTGEILQVPPMYSAKRVKGKRLYKLAREGVKIERDPVKVNIKQLEVLEISLPFVRFRTLCTKGTYIRQLAGDIGDALGCGAHLTELARTRSGKFSLKDAISFKDLITAERDKLHENIIRI